MNQLQCLCIVRGRVHSLILYILLLQRKSLSNSSFLLVLITTNYTECHSSDYVPQIPVVVNSTDACMFPAYMSTCKCMYACVHICNSYSAQTG